MIYCRADCVGDNNSSSSTTKHVIDRPFFWQNIQISILVQKCQRDNDVDREDNSDEDEWAATAKEGYCLVNRDE